ncbi:MAG: hypothetical protein EXR08_09615 [Alphaproteobacteria bacterium]|nr:hypothetical protein [Alphaproteobacteria bacterium]
MHFRPVLARHILAFGLYAVLASLLPGVSVSATLLVSDPDNHQIVFINTINGERHGLPVTGEGPRAIAVSPNGQLAVVSNYGSEQAAGTTLQVINVNSGRLRNTLSIAPYKRPSAIQWLPDNHRALVAVEGPNSLLMIDVATAAIVNSFGAAAATPRQFALTRDGRSVFLGDPAGGKLRRLDTADGKETAVSDISAVAQSLAVSSDGTRLWVVDSSENTIKVLDGGNLRLIAGLDAGNLPMGVALTPNGHYALVSNALSADIAVYDTGTLEQVQLFSTRSVASTSLAPRSEEDKFKDVKRMAQISIPVGIIASPDGLSAFVMNNFSGEIIQFDIFTGAALHVFQGSRRPGGMAYSPVSAGNAAPK